MRLTFLLLFALACLGLDCAQAQPSVKPPAPEKPAAEEVKPADADKQRTELNLLGKTDTAVGESRRNENVQFNLIDNNVLKELNVRLGATATVVREFAPASGYFGAEFGNAPQTSITLQPALKPGVHGGLHYAHLNSAFSARSFFQVGRVLPARDHDYGFNFGAPLWRGAGLFVDAGRQRSRGMVNGNVLVPRPDERTPLAADAATRAIVTRFLAAYPNQLPNRTDINPRALNTNAPQTINNDNAALRLDQKLTARDRLALGHQFTSQHVEAFQLVAGQNPNTDTKSHRARLNWVREVSAATVLNFVLGYDRVTSLLQPEKNAVGPYVIPGGLESLGPQGNIPVDRAQNSIRYGAQVNTARGNHAVNAGVAVIRRQYNGRETDVHRGFFSFSNDFGRDAITNLRLGTPSQFLASVGHVNRGYRYWDLQLYAGDNWKATPNLNLTYGLRYQPTTRPVEVNRLDVLPFDSDWNNVSPLGGFAYRLPGEWGIVRGAYGAHFGEIFPVTFQQVRFSPPGNFKIGVPAPSLVDPLGLLDASRPRPVALATLYQLDPDLAVPYSHQYNVSWEPRVGRLFSLQLGYVGSRTHKLFMMWYTNRAQVTPGVPQTTATVNERRANPDYADIRVVVNASRGYYDAARATLVVANWRGFSSDASYWFSKAIDLGANYTNTANENDSRLSRSQSEFETHRDMKGLSTFDQPHAFLWRLTYTPPVAGRVKWLAKVGGGWNFSAVTLLKSGTPFNVVSGSDGPGFGNVDGNGGDRPNLIDPSILGRAISHPDTAARLLPRSAFAFIKPTDTRGNLGRNVFRKGPIRNVNASLARTWAFRRDARVTLRAESVNLFNTPQFAEPGFELANPNFGQITNTLNVGRNFRFLLQVGW
jgi:hypothetical protein